MTLRNYSFFVLATCLLLSGCSGGTGDLTGKVAYQGKPVVYGTVVAIGPDGLPKSGTIQTDGSYTVSGVAFGTVKLAVSSPAPLGSTGTKKLPSGGKDASATDDKPPPPSEKPVDPALAKAWFPLPEKYGDVKSSELTTTISSSTATHNIDLK